MQTKKWKLYYVNSLLLTARSMGSQEFDSLEAVLAQACEYRVRPGYQVDHIENPEGAVVFDRVALDALCAALP
jgi:hypothetical protein